MNAEGKAADVINELCRDNNQIIPPPRLNVWNKKEKRINTEKRNLNVLIILIQKQKRLFN